ncbi:response regulator transcription factor [Deinococcus roseus]|uniref:DNA-binding response regulator n=1 Tax=Deinococcus roseus TaxID=392414 RepID=A0ABQ2DJT9_9DEIO|nr:response regulator [Deinococcus roseus]GGJ58032.1 DNA-binding response regulator [Deinococcus roseus]
MSTDQPTVHVLDDDQAVREALEFLIQTVGLAVKTYSTPTQFFAEFDAETVGCLIVDIRMPVMSGLQVQTELKTRGMDLPIIMMTGHGDVELCRRAFLNGAVEFLLKPIDDQQLLDALQKAVRQHIQTREKLAVTQQAASLLEKLSPREKEVLDGMLEGYSSKQVAKALGLSPRTVETHRAHIMEKLQVNSLAQLIRLYFHGLHGSGQHQNGQHP